jgi:hemerythrin
MAQLFWSDELLTGVAEIDNQHREVFQQISQFLQACERGQGRAQIEHTLHYFENYVRFHFAAEERVQHEAGYPGLGRHKNLHHELLDKLNDIKADLARSGVTLSASIRVMQFWADWFVKHIALEDKAMADFLRTKGITEI